MFPALPTGRQCAVGASPRMSTTSNAAVFCPSMRNSFTEFTTSTPGRVPSSRTIVSASSKLPWIGTSCAPWMSACASLPNAMCPAGSTTPHSRPARAAYAAADADVFPVEAQIASLAPRSTATDIAIVIPRSLNDAVGLSPSTFNHTRATPARCATRGASSSGVLPSRSVTTGVASETGRNSRYSSITPRHGAIIPLLPSLAAPTPRDARTRRLGGLRRSCGRRPRAPCA